MTERVLNVVDSFVLAGRGVVLTGDLTELVDPKDHRLPISATAVTATGELLGGVGIVGIEAYACLGPTSSRGAVCRELPLPRERYHGCKLVWRE